MSQGGSLINDSNFPGVITINGNSGSVTGQTVSFSGGTTGLTFAGSGSTMTLGGTLGVPNGGTGANSLTGVLVGNGTSPITGVASNTIGSWIFLGSKSASNSATISFTSVITSTYSTYILVYSNVVPATTSTLLHLLVSTNNGVSYITANYETGVTTNAYNLGTFSNQNSTAACLISGTLSNAAAGIAGTVWMYNLQNGQQFIYRGDNTFLNTTPQLIYSICGGFNTATSVNAIQLSMSSGNISTGTFTLYGLLE